MGSVLIAATSLCIFAHFIPVIIKYVIKWMFIEGKNEKYYKKEILLLENEMSSISIVDEFSKYSKAQRKHTKLREDLKNKVSERLLSRTKSQLFFTYAAKFFNGIGILVLINFYRKEPVILLPPKIFWPLNDFLKWPGDYDDSISLVMWIAVTSTVLSSYKNNL